MPRDWDGSVTGWRALRRGLLLVGGVTVLAVAGRLGGAWVPGDTGQGAGPDADRDPVVATAPPTTAPPLVVEPGSDPWIAARARLAAAGPVFTEIAPIGRGAIALVHPGDAGGEAMVFRIEPGAGRLTPIPARSAFTGSPRLVAGGGAAWLYGHPLPDGGSGQIPPVLRFERLAGSRPAGVPPVLTTSPGTIVAGNDAGIWLACCQQAERASRQELARLDPRTLRRLGSVPLGTAPCDVAAGADGGTAWVVDAKGTVYRVDARTNRVTHRIDAAAGQPPLRRGDATPCHRLATGSDAVWVLLHTERGGAVTRIDPDSARVIARSLPNDGRGPLRSHDLVVAGGQAILLEQRRRLVPVDERGEAVGSVFVPEVSSIAGEPGGDGMIWIGTVDGEALLIDPAEIPPLPERFARRR